MKQLTEKQADEVMSTMKTASFTNEHGEKFNIHTNGTFVFMSGDEVNAMVDDKHKIAGKYLPLFNEAFSIWDKEELNALGKALQELTNE